VVQIVQEARACARELVGKKRAQVKTRGCLIHCPRALRGALVGPVPPAAVATVAFERECVVMDTHRAPDCCFLEEVELIGAVA